MIHVIASVESKRIKASPSYTSPPPRFAIFLCHRNTSPALYLRKAGTTNSVLSLIIVVPNEVAYPLSWFRRPKVAFFHVYDVEYDRIHTSSNSTRQPHIYRYKHRASTARFYPAMCDLPVGSRELLVSVIKL